MKDDLYRNFEFKAEVKDLAENGTFSGIASVMGVEDLGGDIIDKGAFNKTLEENANPVILWQHDPGEPIGIGEVKQWQGKLLISGKLDIESDPVAQKAYQKLKGKLVKGLSIGFTTVKASWEEVKENGATRFIRHIQELKLWEVSIVTFPMQTQAQVTRVKSAEPDELIERIGALETRISALSATKSATPPETDGAGAGERAANQTQEPAYDHSRLLHLINSVRSQIT